MPVNLGMLSVERYPIDFQPIDGDATNFVASNNLHVRDRDPNEFIIFTYVGQHEGGMMNAMWRNGVTKWVSNLQPSLPDPIFPKKIQLDWIIYGAGGNDNIGRINADGEIIPVDPSVTGQFSYQFTNESGTVAGKVEGDNGEIRIFALRANGTYALIRNVNGTFFRGATGEVEAYPDEIAAYELATLFTPHFATMSRAGHDHGQDPMPVNLGVLSVERYPIDFQPIDGNADNFVASNNLHVRDREASEFIIFTYYGQDNCGMMNAMWRDGVTKWVTNLQPSLADPIPPKKVQLDWIIYGAGGNDNIGRIDANGETLPVDASVTGQFSFIFSDRNGNNIGRVVGDNGAIRIYALRENGTFAQIRYENGTFFRGATGDTLAYESEIIPYQLAAVFTPYFATISRAGHDHGYYPMPFNLGALSPERYPIDFRPIDGNQNNVVAANSLHVRDRQPSEFIVFTYVGQDEGGMMNAMWRSTVAPAAPVASVEIAEETVDEPIPQTDVIRFAIGYEFARAPFVGADNRVMVPLRSVADSIGAQVSWNSATRTVSITLDGATHTLTIDAPLAGGIGTAVIINNHAFVPMYYLTEVLGVALYWNESTQAVYILQ